VCDLQALGRTKPYRSSGSSETKTYGRRIAMREHKELHTLPRRSFFGKEID
jgi:hypothetical protein